MEYIPLAFVGLLGGAFIFCSLAEFLLWLFERQPSGGPCPSGTQPHGQEGSGLTGPDAERPGPVTWPRRMQAWP
jgi:hypothetical protein